MPSKDKDDEQDDSRDILIELRADMRHVRASIDHFQNSDTKQWEKMDEHSVQIEGHEKDIGVLTWAFRLIAGAIVTGIGGVVVYAVTH